MPQAMAAPERTIRCCAVPESGSSCFSSLVGTQFRTEQSIIYRSHNPCHGRRRMASSKPGRPPEFDRNFALNAALDSFWQYGYGSTSLDDLTAAMGISRSSFYASFKSKHAVLLEVLEIYTSELLARMALAIESAVDPRSAVLALLEIVACTKEPAHGCLFVNSVSELLPADSQVLEIAGRYLGEVEAQVVALLQQLGFSPVESRKRSGAMLALATGAITLRKAGQSSKRIQTMLGLLPSLLT